MEKVSQKKLKEVLTRRLGLQYPIFDLEQVGGKLCGSIISDTFSGRKDPEPQRIIWDALEAEFESKATQLVGTLLAYTENEWNIDLAGATPKPSSKVRSSK